MARIIRLALVESIKPGDPPEVAPDGTILNPEPYHACNVVLDDGITVQVERPLTAAKVRDAWKAEKGKPTSTVDQVSEGDELPPLGPP